MKVLREFTGDLRKQTGRSVPNFDPDDGGIEAEMLFVLQDPEPTVEDTDFISRDNYLFNSRDGSARNIARASYDVDLDRERMISWNAIPWQTPKKDLDKERKTVKRERRLTELLRLFEGRNLRAVALFGVKARELTEEIREARPHLRIFNEGCHPSGQAMANKANRERFDETFRQIKKSLGPGGTQEQGVIEP